MSACRGHQGLGRVELPGWEVFVLQDVKKQMVADPELSCCKTRFKGLDLIQNQGNLTNSFSLL